jgi:hypothetical protein
MTGRLITRRKPCEGHRPSEPGGRHRGRDPAGRPADHDHVKRGGAIRGPHGHGCRGSDGGVDQEPSATHGPAHRCASELAGPKNHRKHIENIYRLTGFMREVPDPVGFKPGPRWQITPVPRDR